MKKLKMIVTSVIVLAIVGSAFAFNAKKIGKFCTSGDLTSKVCNTVTTPDQKTTANTNNLAYYIVDWNGAACNGQTCTTSANFEHD